MTEPESKSEEPGGQANSIKRRLLGAAVLLALAVIFLPLLLDGSGSESRFRRVEKVREYPPRIIGADGARETRSIAKPIESEAISPPEPFPDSGASTELMVEKDNVTTAPTAPAAAPATAAQTPQAIDEPVQVPPELRTNPSAAIDEALVKLGERDAATPTLGAALDWNANASGRDASARDSTDLAAQIAWVIQAGSFQEEGNALRLRDQLRNRGYPSFVSSSIDGQESGVALYRVKVGPVADRQKVERQKREIERITGRSSLLREYR